MRYFWNGYEVTPKLAGLLISIGDNVVTERDDEWFWRLWS